MFIFIIIIMISNRWDISVWTKKTSRWLPSQDCNQYQKLLSMVFCKPLKNAVVVGTPKSLNKKQNSHTSNYDQKCDMPNISTSRKQYSGSLLSYVTQVLYHLLTMHPMATPVTRSELLEMKPLWVLWDTEQRQLRGKNWGVREKRADMVSWR